MKKLLLKLFIVFISLTSGIILISCKPGNTSQPTPYLKNYSFEVQYNIDDNGNMDYQLKWDSTNATGFKILYNNQEITTTNEFISLNNFEANKIHTLKVIATNSSKESEPHEIKFKGTKLTEPYNVRVYGDDADSVGWYDISDAAQYRLLFKEMELEQGTSVPVETGVMKSLRYSNNSIWINHLRELYEENNFSSVQNLSVQAIPYLYSKKFSQHLFSNGVIEFLYPSDISTQSINLYAGNLSNPTNLQWDVSGFDDKPNQIKLKWDNNTSGFEYMVKKINPNDSSNKYFTDVDATEFAISLTDYTHKAGEYSVTVETISESFSHISENAYSFHIKQKPTETLIYNINREKLSTPSNLRIEDNVIICDSIQNAENYGFKFSKGDDYFGFLNFKQNQLSLENLFKVFDDTHEYSLYSNTESGTSYGKSVYNIERFNGDIKISVFAEARNPIVEKVENKIPTIRIFEDSDIAYLENKLKLLPIDVVENVQVDYDNNAITWDDNLQATKYKVYLSRDRSATMDTVEGTRYECPIYADISDYDYVKITAYCEYQIEESGEYIILTVPSICFCELE